MASTHNLFRFFLFPSHPRSVATLSELDLSIAGALFRTRDPMTGEYGWNKLKS